MDTRLTRTIMRRIYYAYAITNPVITGGGALTLLLVMLTNFVSVGDVVRNILAIPVGSLGVFIYSAFANTEVWTLVLLIAFVLLLRASIKNIRLQNTYAV